MLNLQDLYGFGDNMPVIHECNSTSMGHDPLQSTIHTYSRIYQEFITKSPQKKMPYSTQVKYGNIIS